MKVHRDIGSLRVGEALGTVLDFVTLSFLDDPYLILKNKTKCSDIALCSSSILYTLVLHQQRKRSTDLGSHTMVSANSDSG